MPSPQADLGCSRDLSRSCCISCLETPWRLSGNVLPGVQHWVRLPGKARDLGALFPTIRISIIEAGPGSRAERKARARLGGELAEVSVVKFKLQGLLPPWDGSEDRCDLCPRSGSGHLRESRAPGGREEGRGAQGHPGDQQGCWPSWLVEALCVCLALPVCQDFYL